MLRSAQLIMLAALLFSCSTLLTAMLFLALRVTLLFFLLLSSLSYALFCLPPCSAVHILPLCSAQLMPDDFRTRCSWPGFNLCGARMCLASYLPLLFPRHRLRRRDDLLMLFAGDVVPIVGGLLFPLQVVTLSLQLMSNRYSFSMSHCSATSILAMTRRA